MKLLNQKKILLVHPLGYKTEAAGSDVSRLANLMPPLGLASIAAFLETKGINVSIIDCFAHPDSDSVIRDFLVSERPAFIGFSCTTSSFLDGVRISSLAKKCLPEIKTVFGGPHVSALRNRLLDEFPVVDFLVIGEGELTLFQLIESGGRDLHSVQGVVYRGIGDEAHFSGHRSKRIGLDSLPFPAYEKLIGYPNKYKLPIFNYPKTPNTSCISSRGCPYSCSYCDRSVFRQSFRYNSAEYLYEHLLYLNTLFGIRHINFYDDQFTFNRKRVEAFTKKMIDNPMGITFNCAVRAEHIDLDLLRQMKAAGCWMISLGIETGDEQLLNMHRQNADLQMLAEKIRLIKQAEIRTKGLLMLGLPGETENSIQKSMDYVFSLPIDDFNLAKFTPFPGSPIYENIHEKGTFNEDWEKMDCMNFVFVPNTIEKDRLEELFTNFYKTHFSRPKVILGYIAMLWRSPDSWMRFIKNIVGFFKFIKRSDRLADD